MTKKSQTFIKGPYSAGAKHRKRDGLIKIKKGMLLFLFLSNETVYTHRNISSFKQSTMSTIIST